MLEECFPGVGFVVGRLGSGSDALGYDDARSADHDWGCRLTVLVGPKDADLVDAVDRALEDALPEEFAGLPVRFPTTWDARLRHKVEVAPLAGFVEGRLCVDATVELAPLDWLTVTGQAVLEITAGPVFADPGGRLAEVKERLRWYPDDVWRYVLAAGWHRVGQAMPFVGRTGERDDDVGSRLVAAQVVRDLRHLCFLVERRWSPYAKWTGTAFEHLDLFSEEQPALVAAQAAGRWLERQSALAEAAAAVLAGQGRAGLPAPEPATRMFFDRPFVTIGADVVAELRTPIQDPALGRHATRPRVHRSMDRQHRDARPPGEPLDHPGDLPEAAHALIRRASRSTSAQVRPAGASPISAPGTAACSPTPRPRSEAGYRLGHR